LVGLGHGALDERFMAKRNPQRLHLALLCALVSAFAALSVPAHAQFFGSSHYEYGQRTYRPPPSRGFFGSFPFFGGGGGGGGGSGGEFNPFYRPTQPSAPTESYKAPPPRKLETPPTSTVLVLGDSMADWLAYGLDEALADTPDIGVVRNIHPTSGLVRYDPKNEALDWPAALKDTLANDKPSAIVVMLGLTDRLSLRDKAPPHPGAQPAPGSAPAPDKTPGAEPPAAEAAKPDGEQPPTTAASEQRPGPNGSYEFHTDKWAELYSKRIDDLIAALKSKGVPVLWVGLPAVYGTRSTGDMSYLDELFRARAERAGIVYVDIWDGFVDENGRYVSQGPDFEGQTRRLRSSDGVHFTKAGAVKLAQYVAQDLRRVMSSHVIPVALPAPEGAAPPKPGTGPRPVVGPVLPLTADTGGNDGNALVGDSGRTAPANSDPVVTRVLSHGDPIAAPSGRADDFSWPHRNDAGTAEAAPEPAVPAQAPAKAAPSTMKKTDDAKKTAPAAPPAPVRRSPTASLDGAPRPPAPGGGF
jgi:hypothetical protein